MILNYLVKTLELVAEFQAETAQKKKNSGYWLLNQEKGLLYLISFHSTLKWVVKSIQLDNPHIQLEQNCVPLKSYCYFCLSAAYQEQLQKQKTKKNVNNK